MDDTGLLSLPQEVFLHIALYLDLDDLLACSATCSYLRFAFNDNFIWKKQYRKSIVNYVKSAKSVVKPEFYYSEDNESLGQLCEERINLLRQNHMLNNWRHGKFVKHEINTLMNVIFLQNNDRQIIYDNVYLFLHESNTNEINIWNIEEVPFLYTTIKFNIYIHDMEDEGVTRVYYQIVEDKLIVIQASLVQIYNITLPNPELPLEFIFAVDGEEVVSDFDEKLLIASYSWIVGHLLFSIVCFIPVVHVWDILTGIKLKTLQVPSEGWDLHIISLDDVDSVIFSLRTDEPFDEPEEYTNISNHICKYSVSKDEYTTLYSKLTGCKAVHALQYKDSILLFCIDDMFVFRCSIYVFDCQMGLTSAHETFNDLVGLFKSRIIDDRLILATESSVKVLDVKSLAVLQSFKIGDIIDMDYLPILNSTFIVTSSLKNDTEIWDINKQEVLLKIPHQSFVFLNESCSKLVIISEESLEVKSFW